MTDQTDLAALLERLYLDWKHGNDHHHFWDYAAPRLHAAGVRVTGWPTIDQLRAAVSFHEDDNGHSPIGCVVCEYRAALRVTGDAGLREAVWNMLRRAHRPHVVHAWDPPEGCDKEPCATLAHEYAALTDTPWRLTDG